MTLKPFHTLMLEPHEIHLWFTFYDEIKNHQLLNKYRSLLTEKEQQQEKRFHFEKDQLRYLVTRALVRTVLSRYIPIHPREWIFSANSYGKPEIANDDLIAKKISFNISHTQGLIVLGVTNDKALGLDAENINRNQISLEIGRHFFSSNEATALYQLPKEMQSNRFFQYWTLKESYIKARGMGLSIPLDQFAFYFPRDKEVAISIEPQLNDFPSRWRFWQFQPSPDFIAAVCVERSTEPNQNLVMTKVVPLENEEALACTLLHASL